MVYVIRPAFLEAPGAKLDGGNRGQAAFMAKWQRLAALLLVLTWIRPAWAAGSDVVVQALTTEFTLKLITLEAQHANERRRIDDERGEIEEKFALTVTQLGTRITSLRSQLRAAIQAGSRESTKNQKQIESLQSQLAQANNDATNLAMQNAETRAALEAYRANTQAALASASPEELAAYQRFVDGDDASFEIVDRLTRAEIAADTARIAAKRKNLAQMMELRFWRGTVTLDQVASYWQEAIDGAPANTDSRLAFCNFVYRAAFSANVAESTGAASVDPSVARSTCEKVSEGAREVDRPLFAMAIADGEGSVDHDQEALDAAMRGLATIDTLIRNRQVSRQTIIQTGYLARYAADAEASLARAPLLRACQGLSRGSREFDEIFKSTGRAAAHHYDEGAKRIEAIVALLGEEAEPEGWRALERMAESMKDDNPSASFAMYFSLEAKTRAQLKKHDDFRTHEVRARVLDALDFLDEPAKDEEVDPAKSYIAQLVVERRWLAGTSHSPINNAIKFVDALVDFADRLALKDSVQRLALYSEAIGFAKKVLGNALEPAAQGSLREASARSYSGMGRVRDEQQEYRGAVEAYRQAVAEYRAHMARLPENSGVGERMLEVMGFMARAQELGGDTPAAIATLDAILTEAEGLKRRFLDSASEYDYIIVDTEMKQGELTGDPIARVVPNP